ncbi:MAG: GNAT family N-acetyltransferase [Anaerolineae bacterium]|nr:GNAT family N-acetyltransferase [Anaerolineae bacterium]
MMSALENGLILRTAASERDVERVAVFNGKIHGEVVYSMTRQLFLHHPHTSLDDLIFVENEQSGEVVSSLCLIPWTLRYEDVEIRSGEMGIVGTHEDYRGRGLIRKQVEVFKQRLRQRGCLLSQIQGIPYFYRQFGYEYAIPLERWLMLEMRHIPAQPDATFTFRQATVDDIPTLTRLYDQAANDRAVHNIRDEAIWRYLLTDAKETETERDILLVESAGGQAAGYVCVAHHGFGVELIVNEVSRLSYDAGLATLDCLKQLAAERKKPGIRLNLPPNCAFSQVALSLGGHDDGAYAWQIYVPDGLALLRAIAPVLERRVAASPFAGMTHDVCICLYRETIRLRFESGKLTEVTNLGATNWEGEPIHIPPQLFVPLVLGYRTRQELQDAHPDVNVWPGSRMVLDTLFPKMASFIYTNY